MKLKDWVAVTVGIDEFDIFGTSRHYYPETKSKMLFFYGENEINEIFIETLDREGAWVRANIYLK